MSFFKFLQGIGDRLGVLESVPAPETVPATRIQTRTISLLELASEIRSGDVRSLADSPAKLLIPFEEIFCAAGISSKSEDWTINRLKKIIDSESGSQKSREALQKAVLEQLHTNGVQAEILVKDAMARDHALDDFENRVNEKMRDRNQFCRQRLVEIDTQIKCLQEERARIGEDLEADETKWSEWRRRKRMYERELASLASYIVDHPVVTTDEEE